MQFFLSEYFFFWSFLGQYFLSKYLFSVPCCTQVHKKCLHSYSVYFTCNGSFLGQYFLSKYLFSVPCCTQVHKKCLHSYSVYFTCNDFVKVAHVGSNRQHTCVYIPWYSQISNILSLIKTTYLVWE